MIFRYSAGVQNVRTRDRSFTRTWAGPVLLAKHGSKWEVCNQRPDVDTLQVGAVEVIWWAQRIYL
jgi:hypothetical protein